MCVYGLCTISLTLADDKIVTLEDAIRTGLSTNPEFQSVFNTEKSVEQRLIQTKAAYLPSVDLQADTGFEVTDTPIIQDQSEYRNQMTVTMSQLIFDGQATTHQIDRQNALYKAARHRTIEAAQLVSLNITNSYLNVLRSSELLHVAEKNLKYHKRFFARIKDGTDNGRFNKGDLAQVESRLSLAEANYENVARNYEQARSAYVQATGVEPDFKLTVSRIDPNLLPKTVAEYTRYAIDHSPTLQSFKAEVNAAEFDYQSSKGSFYPTVNFEVTGSQGRDLGGIEGEEKLASALLVMRWNLFRGGADKAAVKERSFSKRIAQEDLANAERTLVNDIRSIWATRNATARQIDLFSKQVKANEDLVRIYQEQFDINRRSLLDLLDTQSALFASENSKVNAVFNTLFASYQLLALSGDLLKAFNIDNTRDLIEPPKPIAADKGLFKPLSPIEKFGILQQNEKSPALNLNVSAEKDTLIQLGVFDTEDEAQKNWRDSMKAHKALLKDMEYFIEETQLPEDGNVYRLRFGPTDRVTAQETCAKINEDKSEECILVKS